LPKTISAIIAPVRDLYLFVAISAANHLAFTGSRLAVILYAVHLQASPATVGMLSALFGLVSCFTSVSAGRFMDRIGPGRPMMWSSVVMAVGALVAALWPSIAALVIVATLVGTFYNFFFLGHSQWIGRIGAPSDRVRNFSLASIGFSIAAFLGPLTAGFLIDGLGHPAAFLFVALVPLFPLAVIASKALVAPPGRGQSDRKSVKHGSVVELLRERRLLRIYGVSALAHATWSIVHFLVPVYGVQIGLSASTIGIILGSYSIASIVIRAFMTLLARRFTTWQLMLMSLTFTGLCFVVFPLVTAIPLLMLAAFGIGIGMGMAGPLSQALLYDASPPERVGEVMGLRLTAMNLNQTLVPILAGAAGAAVGVAPVFWTLATLLIGGSYATRAQWRYHRRREMNKEEKQ
jgi:MFS family permease